MADKKIIKNEFLNEQYSVHKHKSGLTIMMYQNKNFSSAYALFGTKYGSLDNSFKTANEDAYKTYPAGIAHFLEHKLFESEDGDAFMEYAKTGASANAFTSYDRTCYEFSCTDKFRENLLVLLKCVTTPYFTAQNVQKEQGIIAEEIKMYEDNAEWRVFLNLLSALYIKHPISIDIVGTVKSISKIDKNMLYDCYNTFYNLNNMVLVISGNFEEQDVIDCCDAILKPSENVEIVREKIDEPCDEILKSKIEQQMPISTPIFEMGYKHKFYENGFSRGYVLHKLVLDVLFSETSEFYNEFYNKGLINATFSYNAMVENDVVLTSVSGECKEPEQLYDEIIRYIEKCQNQGVDAKLFELSKKATLGRMIRSFQNIENVANEMVISYFYNTDIFEKIDILNQITIDDVNDFLRTQFNSKTSALSIINPIKGE